MMMRQYKNTICSKKPKLRKSVTRYAKVELVAHCRGNFLWKWRLPASGRDPTAKARLTGVIICITRHTYTLTVSDSPTDFQYFGCFVSLPIARWCHSQQVEDWIQIGCVPGGQLPSEAMVDRKMSVEMRANSSSCSAGVSHLLNKQTCCTLVPPIIAIKSDSCSKASKVGTGCTRAAQRATTCPCTTLNCQFLLPSGHAQQCTMQLSPCKSVN